MLLTEKKFTKNVHRCYVMCYTIFRVIFMNFPSVVKYSRGKLGMSQEEMAHALRISFATINRWENGKTTPNKMAISVFCEYCEKRGLKIREMLQEDNRRDSNE